MALSEKSSRWSEVGAGQRSRVEGAGGRGWVWLVGVRQGSMRFQCEA